MINVYFEIFITAYRPQNVQHITQLYSSEKSNISYKNIHKILWNIK